MIVGSTNTIVYLMYKEKGIKIPQDMAGLMLSGILSDTLILNSPTTTQIDKDADVEIINPELEICTLVKGGKIDMELTIANGKGYVDAKQNQKL